MLCLSLSLGATQNEVHIENSNFTLSQASFPSLLIGEEEERYLYNYDRLRISDTLKNEAFYATAIVDLVNYAGASYIQSPEFIYMKQLKPDIPFEIQTDFHYCGEDKGVWYGKIHRFYGGYDDGRHHARVGIQNIPMGVGHIWTPTDLYNPKNSFALEPDEVFGVMALSYTYTPSALSTIQTVMSLKEDESYKYGFRYKTFLDFADVGVSFIYSDNVRMLGYEIEGDFFDTGVQWRSEGGYYQSIPLNTEFYQAIMGFDYAFKNGINWTLEGFYSSKVFSYKEKLNFLGDEIFNNMVQSNVYLGTTLTYDFNLVWSASILWIESFKGSCSSFITPVLTYTVNDHNTISLGGLIYTGNAVGSEFGDYGNSLYLNWKWNF